MMAATSRHGTTAADGGAAVAPPAAALRVELEVVEQRSGENRVGWAGSGHAGRTRSETGAGASADLEPRWSDALAATDFFSSMLIL